MNEKIKLYVKLINNHDSWMAAQVGSYSPVKTRVVEIELTQQQSDALKPRIVGKSNGKTILEEMEVVSLETLETRE